MKKIVENNFSLAGFEATTIRVLVHGFVHSAAEANEQLQPRIVLFETKTCTNDN